MWTRPPSGAILLAVMAWMGAVGCTNAPGSAALTVFAASSLADVAEDLTDEWAIGSDIAVELVVGGSNHLAAQLRDGAPADAFLTADADLLAQLEITGRRADDLAHNHLVVARPADGPDRVPSDLHDPSLVLVTCASGVPCGDATAARFGNLPTDSHEPSVRAVISRLLLDEADLGIVYVTDVAAHPGLIPAWPQEAACPCVSYAAAGLSAVGDRFVTFLASDQARIILKAHGFATEAHR